MPSGEPATHFKAAPLEIEQNFEPGLLTFAIAVGDGDQFLLSLVRGPDDHQDALLLFLHAGAEIDAVHPEIDVALGREVAPLPALRTSFSRVIVEAESPGAELPRSAAKASPKSPVEMPFRYSHGKRSSRLLARRR